MTSKPIPFLIISVWWMGGRVLSITIDRIEAIFSEIYSGHLKIKRVHLYIRSMNIVIGLRG